MARPADCARPLLALLAALCAAGRAEAGGLWLWETGNAAVVGMAGAGWGAGDESASTAWTNPAAMTRLERSELSGQLTPAVARFRFDPDSATSNSGSRGEDTALLPLLGGAGVWAATPDLRLGIATAGIAGGTLDYGSDWVGRYAVTEVALNVLGVAPGFAWRASQWLSLGGSVTVGYASLDQEANVNNLLPGQPDGKLQLEDTDFGVGGTLGVLLEPRPGTRVAITYRTPMKLELRNEVDFENILPPLSTAVDALGLRSLGVEMDAKIPQQILIGIEQQISEELALVLNADWEDWSEFGALQVAVVSDTQQSVSEDLASQDTWHVAAGVRWRVRPAWLLTAGVGWDSSMFDTSDRSAVLPMDRQIRVGAGVQYAWSENLELGFGYEYANLGRAPIQRSGGPLVGDLYGDFERNEIHFFTLSVNWGL